MTAERKRSGSGSNDNHKGGSWEHQRSRIVAGIFGGKKSRAAQANGKPHQQDNPLLVYSNTILSLRDTCASEYWIFAVARHGGATYAPDQRCRCPRCMEANPDRLVATPDGRMLIPGGVLWPRQAADVIRCHFECRQIETAPRDNGERVKKWKPAGKATGWIGGERGCWRRRILASDEAVAPRLVRVRAGRRLIGFEETTVVSAVEGNAHQVYEEQVVDPLMLAELNGICRDGEDSGLVDELAGLDSSSSVGSKRHVDPEWTPKRSDMSDAPAIK